MMCHVSMLNQSFTLILEICQVFTEQSSTNSTGILTHGFFFFFLRGNTPYIPPCYIGVLVKDLQQ